MPETRSPLRLVRFGAFEADLRTGELRKDGVKLKFSGQPFQVLAILLEHPGEVVTREELQKRLWPDTFVDVERNLNTAVNKIREVLGDSAEAPRFVETLPRRGYRFIGEMQTPVPPADPVDNVEPVRGHHRRPLKIGGGVLAVSLIAIAALVAYRWHRPPRPAEQGVLTAVPFTALPGVAFNPAFSPDGSRIAFAWSPAPETNGTVLADLYVKALGSETLLRLTQHPSAIARPAWSPDGTQIAFLRWPGADSGIYVVPALGGPEQKLYSARTLANLSWSPDGKWIAFLGQPPLENHSRIYLLSMETLAIRQIPENPKCFDERSPTFSHNGEYLAYWCFQTHYDAVLYTVSPSGGKPKMVAPSLAEPGGLAWSADDTKLIYSNSLGDFSAAELVEVSVANGSAKRLGLEGIQPAVAPGSNKLAYTAISHKSSVLRRDLLHPEAAAVEFAPSSRAQFDAQYSPDGKRVVFASHRSGAQGVWISNEDGSNLVQISDPRYNGGSPQWSPDGTKIVFDASPGDFWGEIYVADVAERKPRKLVTNIRSAIRPNWSRDGKWIYFASQEPGNEGVYRCPASGGDATAISKDIHGLNSQESFDGSTAYFASYFQYAGSPATLKRVPLPGRPGTESEVNGSLHVSIAENWTLSPGGIYFVPADAPNAVRYFEFASRRIRTIFAADHDLFSGLSISPDGRWILYSQESSPTGDIMLVDHFR